MITFTFLQRKRPESPPAPREKTHTDGEAYDDASLIIIMMIIMMFCMVIISENSTEAIKLREKERERERERERVGEM